MKSRILRKLCVYAVSASMMLPASAPVMAATTTSVVRDYRESRFWFFSLITVYSASSSSP